VEVIPVLRVVLAERERVLEALVVPVIIETSSLEFGGGTEGEVDFVVDT
jgi:hypothetical protein